MRTYDFTKNYEKLLTPDIVALLTQIHEYKGEQALFIEAKADTLTKLVEIAKIQSTESSNKIEGIYTSDERLKKLVQDKTTPRTRNEQEIAGYRDVLATIHESFDYIPPKASMILQLHRDLYKFSGASYGGHYKTADNVIAETDAQGNKSIRFQPLPAWETPEAVDSLCRAYEEAVGKGDMDPLLLIPMFILDFLCIHPFRDGNGRMSRLLTTLLLYRAGYEVGKYISLEAKIAKNKGAYYDALELSQTGWHEEKDDPTPFIKYLLGTIISAYRDFEDRMEIISPSSEDTVRKAVESRIGKFTKREITELCPNISASTVERNLRAMVNNGELEKQGAGKSTVYIRRF